MWDTLLKVFTYNSATWLHVSLPQAGAQAYPELAGVDTEAAEQVFSIANRWQANLSNCHPVHFHLQLLLFAREHNSRTCCAAAHDRYCAAQRLPFRAPAAGSAEHLVEAAAGDTPTSCEPPRPRPRKRKLLQVVCQSTSTSAAQLPPPAAGEEDAVEAQPLAAASEVDERPCRVAARSFLRCDNVLLNEASRTVHKVIAQVTGATCVGCSWIPPHSSRATPTAELTGTDLFSCGTCFGQRLLLDLD